MKNLFNILVLLGVSVFSGTLTAQTSPPVYYGPYEQASAAQFEGDWTRSDGTYRLVISVNDGEIEAQYLNPESINVESVSLVESEVGSEAKNLTLEVVLRDEGYPGSTYRLQYIPQYRVLAGSYTIPGQEPAEVFFTQ